MTKPCLWHQEKHQSDNPSVLQSQLSKPHVSHHPPTDYDDEDTEDEDWVTDLRNYLSQHLIHYLSTTTLAPEQQEIYEKWLKHTDTSYYVVISNNTPELKLGLR